jgi:hypothetical protein
LTTTAIGAIALAAAATVASRVARARVVERLAEGLHADRAEERVRAARALVDAGLRTSASELLLFVRTEHDPTVLEPVARAISDAPAVNRPSANLRELLQWARAELDDAASRPVPYLRVARDHAVTATRRDS